MFSVSILSLLASAFTLTNAGVAPALPNFNLVWSETFDGAAGSEVNLDNWVHRTGPQSNNEVETYTTSTENCALTGAGSVLITPLESATGEWTSCRIETNTEFTADEGSMMIVQALIRLGSNAGIGNHAGIWPAFWALGGAVRRGTEWPQCGEWDVMENINAEALGHGTLHCASCEGNGALSSATEFSYDGFHTWAMAVDRTNKDWTLQELRYYMDGNLYNVITGADVADQASWEAVTAEPFFLILNVAVGGDWSGPPTVATASGAASAMEVQYVGVYKSI
ncbi:glycosyl hydrolase family 16 [Phlyctema vagabunda]|uniref:Glycosyl hydrolase family 16 n=1 Tax=Phlyctema vagabunda TaxID=108571 RepID=A0ABR4PG77_9HELO